MKAGRAVIATNIETGDERTFESLVAAARHCYMSVSSVHKALKHNKPMFGYTFRDTKRMRRIQAEVIVAMAENNLSMNKSAKKLGKKHDTIRSHVDNIYDTLGKDARNFFDMCELYPMAKAILEGEQC